MKELDDGMNRLKGALSPRGIIDASARVQATVDRMKAEAKLTSGAIAPDLLARLQLAEAAVAAATPRAQRLAEMIAGIVKHARLAADGYSGKGIA